jgi:hypothetical protein
MTRARAVALAAVAIGFAGLAAWRGLPWGDEREIRATLESLAEGFNASTSDGLGTLARAAQLGSYFSDNVIVDLGPGSAAIEGRERLIGMAARLQPRTAAYRVVLDDISVETPGAQGTADVTLTVSFIRRDPATDEESTDAREFALQMIKGGGRWRIERATAIDTFRK